MATKNKFPARCNKCGQMVAKGEGTVERVWDQATGGHWITVHNHCPEPQPKTAKTVYIRR